MNAQTSLPKAVLVLLISIVGVECVLFSADMGWIGSLRWRSLVYQNGAFWPGLLGDWQANYTIQPITMFLSYGFLHADLSHMAGNAVTLFLLGPRVYNQLGLRGFLWVILASTLCGALTFASLHESTAPMVGASGVVFGLAGALTAGLWFESASRRRKTVQITAIIAGLIILNAVIWVGLAGLLAWETHLGGFIAGFVAAYALPRKYTALS